MNVHFHKSFSLHRCVIPAVVLLLTGCASHRDGPPDLTASTAATAEDTVGCLVRELDAQFPGSPFFGGVDHHAVLIVPGQIYEVTPTRDLMVGGENYFVRVAAVESGATLALHGPWNWVHALQPAVEACGDGAISGAVQ